MKTRTLLVSLLAGAVVAGGIAAIPALRAQDPAGPAAAAPQRAAVAKLAKANDATPFIVNGQPATEAPSFMISLQSPQGHFCGASLISDRLAVTAAHCVVEIPPQAVQSGEVKARVGTLDNTRGGTLATVGRIMLPPNAAPNGGDIAMVQLRQRVQQQPIRIADQVGRPGTPTRIIGWGQTCPQPGGCGTPRRLQQLDTQVAPTGQCRGGGVVGRTEICVGSPRGTGACFGDSGGPMVQQVNGRLELIGATSRSGNGNERCATGPAIYTNVVAFKSWIQRTAGQLQR
ncbi:serine protease [Longimycelium tulufanense]|uniref:Serine protease n=1 Tax=Longimycelium tulufanense TaxID=907463 RepID=A0A8J3C8V4_9PSEU|nr:serine protease [Longimycelium tulufanense]GGM35757.1 serine protease [Longimycelium tulufanense]